MKMEAAKKLVREMPYYDMVIWRVCDEMSNSFYEAHKERLDKLKFLIESHQQDTEIENGNRFSTTK